MSGGGPMTMNDWRVAAGRMRADLDRAALNENPRQVVAVLIRATLMKGRTTVVLPDREGLCGLLGIAKQHMKRVWEEIATAGVVTFRKVELGWECVVVADASQWACEFVYTREQVNQWVDWLDRVHGQAQGGLLPPDPNLRQALAETAAERVSNKVGYCRPPAEGWPVTKLVTAGAEAAGKAEVSGRAVPASGAFKVQGLKANNASKTLNLKGGDRHRDRQREFALMDRCRAVFGEENMAAYGGNWRLRIRQDAEVMERVLAETERAKRAGEVRSTPGAYANDLWKRWA